MDYLMNDVPPRYRWLIPTDYVIRCCLSRLKDPGKLYFVQVFPALAAGRPIIGSRKDIRAFGDVKRQCDCAMLKSVCSMKTPLCRGASPAETGKYNDTELCEIVLGGFKNRARASYGSRDVSCQAVPDNLDASPRL